MKPRFKIGSCGTYTLVRAGLSGLSEGQIRSLMIRASGSVASYCRRHGLNYEVTRSALLSRRVCRFDSVAATRVLLGLPVNLRNNAQSCHRRSEYTQAVFSVLRDGHAELDYPDVTKVARLAMEVNQ